MYSYKNDISLWDDFRNGDEEAYKYIYMTYSPVLYNYGFKFCYNHHITSDAIQETFVYLYIKKAGLGMTSNIKFYLLKSLRREIVRKINQEKKRSISGDISEVEFLLTPSIEDKIVNQDFNIERERRIKLAISDLPKRQHEAIFLRFYEELSYEEIAQVMGLEQKSAYKIIYKALDSLQEKLVAKIAMS
jgi:RNA polymerase sigma-70 factor (ECF subfamily)